MSERDWKATVQPRRWQCQALKSWINSERRGVVSVVTGGGKTSFAHLCIQEIRAMEPHVRIIILVPTLTLLDQWYVSLQDGLRVPERDIACFSSEERGRDFGPITIIVLNTARTVSESSFAHPTFLIVDECHRAGSPENSKALRGRHIATLGLSATPVRDYDDGFATSIEPALGKVIFEYGYDEALADKVISPFDLINVRVALLSDEERQYARLTRAAIGAHRSIEKNGSGERLKIVLQRRAQISSSATMRIPVAVKIVEQYSTLRTILFHEKISAADRIRSILEARGQRSVSYHSRLSPATRRDNLRLFRRGAFDSLITCRALDEGLDVPDASVAIIASSTASRRQRIQRIGRVLRPAIGKERARIYTLFATEAERKRLVAEAASLDGLASVTWQEAL